MKHTVSERVRRFDATERVYHWVQGLPFLVLMLTGGLLWLQRLLGFRLVAPSTLVSVHVVSGCALPVGILLVVVGGNRRSLLDNVRRAVAWTARDLRWLMLAPVHAFFPRVRLPRAGKFNAGQKINLLLQVVLIPVFLATGLVMWLGHGVLLAWYVHVAAFLVATPVIAVHLFMAIVNRETRKSLPGVFTGEVDAAWAREHHGLEYGPRTLGVEHERRPAPTSGHADLDRSIAEGA